MFTKKCRQCEKSKPLKEFYAHKMMADGYLNKCKACVKIRVSDHRKENIEAIREYDRLRGALSHRKENTKKVHKARQYDPLKKEVDRNRKLKWQMDNADKRACHIIVGNAIKNKRITPKDCEGCGLKYDRYTIQAHHEDYTKPLDVIWYCRSCHGARHRQLNEQRRSKIN